MPNVAIVPLASISPLFSATQAPSAKSLGKRRCINEMRAEQLLRLELDRLELAIRSRPHRRLQRIKQPHVLPTVPEEV